MKYTIEVACMPEKNGWRCDVTLSGEEKYTYSVTLDTEYWNELKGNRKTPDELVTDSFQFLLDREPATSILKTFDLKVINTYFPEYQELI